MKKLTLFVVMAFVGICAQAAKPPAKSTLGRSTLTDQQAMKCINGDSQTKSAFQDIQAAYEMRLVSAKDFFKVMEKPVSCPQLKKDIKKLRVAALASFPREKAKRIDSEFDSPSGGGFGGGAAGFSGESGSDFSGFPPPPPPMDDFTGDDFSDFR